MGTLLDEYLGEDPKNNKQKSQRTLLDDVLYYNKTNEHATDVPLGQYGVGESSYDTNITPSNVDQLNEIRAQAQGSLTKLGSGLVNAITQTGLDIIKDSAYLLDYENYTDFKKSSEEGFDNWLSKSIQSVEDKLKLPVYRTKESEGFSPTSAGWWAENMPSIASTISMAIPAELAVKGLSVAGKALGGNKVIKGIENISGIKNLDNTVKGVTGAVLSRQMENLMEGAQTFEQTKKEALEHGATEEEANKIAGDAASTNYKANWVNLTTDIPQYLLLHKTFKQALKDKKFKFSDLAKTALQEGGEEAYQYITNEESKRNALINGGKLKDDKSTIINRLGEYVKDGEFWTSAFLGGLGGSIFGGIASYKDSRNLPKLQQQYEVMSKLHEAVVKNDEENFNRESDNLFVNELMSNIKDNKIDEFKSILNETIQVPEDIKERGETQIKLNERNDVIEFAKDYMNNQATNSELSPELKALQLSVAIDQKLTNKRLTNINTDLSRIQSEDISLSGLSDPSLYQFKLSKLKLEALEGINDPNLKSQIKDLTKSINDNYKMLLSEGLFKSKEDIDKVLTSVNDEKIVNLLKNQIVENENLKNTRDVIYSLKTEDGIKAHQELVDKIKKQQEDDKIKEAEKQSKEEAKESKEAPKEAELNNEKVEHAQMMFGALNAGNIESFDPVYEKLIKSPLLSKSEKEQLEAERKKHLNTKFDPTNPANHTNINLDDLTIDGISNEPKEDESEDVQSDVSKFLNTNTDATTKEENQLDVTPGNVEIIEAGISEKHIASRNNIVMMRLFDHFITKVGLKKYFSFKRNVDGFPQYNNNSGIDIVELNKLKVGNTVELKML